MCGTRVVQYEGEVALRCPNPDCPAQVRRRVQHFASKAGVDIEGLGEAMVDTLVEKGWVKSIADIYRLRRDDLLTLGKSVEKSTDNLLAAIEASKRAELWRFINGLGITHVGVGGGQGPRAQVRQPRGAGRGEARRPAGIEGIGETMADAIIAHFNEPRNRDARQPAAHARRGPDGAGAPGRAARPPWPDKTFVLTGTLPTMTRETGHGERSRPPAER